MTTATQPGIEIFILHSPRVFSEKKKYIYIQMAEIPEGHVYVPRLEPTAPIRLADRNHAHYLSRHCTTLKKKMAK